MSHLSNTEYKQQNQCVHNALYSGCILVLERDCKCLRLYLMALSCVYILRAIYRLISQAQIHSWWSGVSEESTAGGAFDGTPEFLASYDDDKVT